MGDSSLDEMAAQWRKEDEIRKEKIGRDLVSNELPRIREVIFELGINHPLVMGLQYTGNNGLNITIACAAAANAETGHKKNSMEGQS